MGIIGLVCCVVVVVFMDIIVLAQAGEVMTALEILASRAWCTLNVQGLTGNISTIQEMANKDLAVFVGVNVVIVGVSTTNETGVSPE